VLTVLAGGCGAGAVPVDAPTPEGEAARSCAALVDDLPGTVADLDRREVEAGDAPAAAWGDPAIVLTCGVGPPRGLDELATCQETNGVGWFIPEAQITGEPEDIVMTTIDRVPRVQVRLPEDHWPPAAAMSNLAKAIKAHTRQTKPCL
jgi:hypothetical protein